MIYKHLLFLLLAVLLLACNSSQKLNQQANDWVDLLDEDLSAWEKFIGVPHESVDLAFEHPKSSDGKTGIPLGLNNDPKNVFQVQKDETGELQLYITGEIFGALSTKKEYENYHLRCMFKWGEKKWAPRLNAKRDNGLLYHCTGEHGAFWNVWMRCLEMQVQEGDMGDFFPLAGTMAESKGHQIADKKGLSTFDPKGETLSVSFGKGFDIWRVIRSVDNEKPNGAWNLLEIYTIGDLAVHVVNGKVVNALSNARYKVDGATVPLRSGKIQIQSEAAAAYYKHIQMRSIQKFPNEIAEAAGF